jgi:hypothetical protein
MLLDMRTDGCITFTGVSNIASGNYIFRSTDPHLVSAKSTLATLQLLDHPFHEIRYRYRITSTIN